MKTGGEGKENIFFRREAVGRCRMQNSGGNYSPASDCPPLQSRWLARNIKTLKMKANVVIMSQDGEQRVVQTQAVNTSVKTSVTELHTAVTGGFARAVTDVHAQRGYTPPNVHTHTLRDWAREGAKYEDIIILYYVVCPRMCAFTRKRVVGERRNKKTERDWGWRITLQMTATCTQHDLDLSGTHRYNTLQTHTTPNVTTRALR